jgi:DNA-binding transcriptional ArsR family regulator
VRAVPNSRKAMNVDRVDFIHRNPILAGAVAAAWKRLPRTTAQGMVYTSWVSFSREHLFAALWIVVDAYMDDYVPLPLKVRSLSVTGRRCIVLGELSPVQERALIAEGAVAILDGDLTAEEIPERVEKVVAGNGRVHGSIQTVGTELTDREVQILELYARRGALTAPSLAAALGLSPSTVRKHLTRGRSKLARCGFSCGTRADLARTLQEIGYSHTDDQWRATGQW